MTSAEESTGDKVGRPGSDDQSEHGFRSIRDLIDTISGRNIVDSDQGDAGFAEHWPFPFLALVGQKEIKLGLLLAMINPNIGGVLLIGPRGTGKTTVIRSLIDLMPYVQDSLCYYGCLEEDIETGGQDAVCPACAEKYGKGLPLSMQRQARLVELPLNAKMEDVLGSVAEGGRAGSRTFIRRGILSRADQNILFIDEVNLLRDDVVDVILDAAAQRSFTVRRDQMAATYRSRFSLVGTMNPEEGGLRPQILDRFGLRIMVKGLDGLDERMLAYERSRAYMVNPKQVVEVFADETSIAREEVQAAKELLPKVVIPPEVSQAGLVLIKNLGIASLRAEITLFEAARALAAADGREIVSIEDIRQVATMALRLRQSDFMDRYFDQQSKESERIAMELNKLGVDGTED
jgi:magnesium chelatase subunit I